MRYFKAQTGWLTLLVLLMIPVAQAQLPRELPGGETLPSLAPMVERVAPAVVNIATFAQVQYRNPLLNDPFFRRFFNIPEQPQPQRRANSAGSGVIVDAEKGHVLTNHHVIAGASEIVVTLNDGRQFSAEVLGSDEETDIALIQIPAKNLTEVELADPDSLRVGDFVVAIGNPFTLGQTVTSGIVSALGRKGLGIYNYEDFIQTDASINPGNSGGALVNLRGELVGINSAILSPAGGNVGIGFAIPVSIALAVKDQLAKFGEVQRGQLGALFQDLTPRLAEAFNLEERDGALIAKVRPGSPAARAGLRPGDIVVAVNGKPITSAADMRNRLGLSPVGKPLKLEVIRQGERLEVTTAVEIPKAARVNGEVLHPDLAGVVFEDLIDNSAGRAVGVRVASVASSSQAYQAGMREGDRLLSVNRRRIQSVEVLKRIAGPAEELLLQLQRNGRQFYLVTR